MSRTLWARQATTLIQALITGSLFYAVSDTTGALFLRGGAIFLTLLCESELSAQNPPLTPKTLR